MEVRDSGGSRRGDPSDGGHRVGAAVSVPPLPVPSRAVEGAATVC